MSTHGGISIVSAIVRDRQKFQCLLSSIELAGAMVLAAFSFAEAILPLVLLDGSGRNHRCVDYQQIHVSWPAASASILVASTSGDAPTAIRGSKLQPPRPDGSKYAWNLPNGRVEFDCPLSFGGISAQEDGTLTSDADASVALTDPKLLGRCALHA